MANTTGKKYGGRQSGTPNKVTLQLRESITLFLEGNFAIIENDFKNLTPSVRAKVFCELLPFAVPKLQAASVDVKFENLTDDQVENLFNKVMAEIK